MAMTDAPRRPTACSALLLLLGLATGVGAVKDSAWHGGIETPNVDLPMYWGDMPNILEDLGNFTHLYVQFHSCAWTQLGGFGDQENTGKDVEEDDYWYMGAMNSGVGWSYAPQIAFSLYGTLKGSRHRGGCGKRTYINSFYTTSGFYAFSNEIANAGISNNGNDFSLYCQSGTGLSCSSKGNGFSLVKYNSNYCTPGYEQTEYVPDTLATFNQALSDASCVQIYDASTGYVPYLLYHSRSCELRDEVGSCPDPYGMKSMYQRRLSRALAGLAPDSVKFHREMARGYTLLGIGVLFIVSSALLIVYEKYYGPRKVVTAGTVDINSVDIESTQTEKVPPEATETKAEASQANIEDKGQSKVEEKESEKNDAGTQGGGTEVDTKGVVTTQATEAQSSETTTNTKADEPTEREII